MDEVLHGPRETVWSNLGQGWFMECLCGWSTPICRSLESVGEEMDDHIRKEVPTYGR